MDNPTGYNSHQNNQPPIGSFPNYAAGSNLPNPYHRSSPQDQPTLINGITRINAIVAMIITSAILMFGLIFYSITVILTNNPTYQSTEQYKSDIYNLKILANSNSTVIDSYDVFHNGEDIKNLSEATYIQAASLEKSSIKTTDFFIKYSSNKIIAVNDLSDDFKSKIKLVAPNLKCKNINNIRVSQAQSDDDLVVLRLEANCDDSFQLKALQKYQKKLSINSMSMLIATSEVWQKSDAKFKDMISSLEPASKL